MPSAMSTTLVVALAQLGVRALRPDLAMRQRAGTLVKSGVRSLPDLATRQMHGECVSDADGFVFLDNAKITGLPSQTVMQAEPSLQTATEFDVTYIDNYKVLTNNFKQEQYILTQCGTTAPTDAQLTVLPSGFVRKHFTIPIQSAMVDTTVALGFLERLGVHDRVSYVSRWASGACWQEALSPSCLRAVSSNQTIKATQHAEAQLVFTDSYYPDVIPNGVQIPTTQDAGNLHSAEYIKVFAAFFNKEQEAKAIWDQEVAEYLSAKTQAAIKPKVAWISFAAAYPPWTPVASFVVSEATYKLQLVEHAGGENAGAGALLEAKLGNKVEVVTASSGKTFKVEVDRFNSETDAAAAFFDALKDVDVLIDETYQWDPAAYTMTEFWQTMGLDDSAFDWKVVRNDATLSPGGGSDWFESRVASPDLAVDGLARVLHDDVSKDKLYFRDLTKGEMPDVMLASSCSKNLPICDSSLSPVPIKIVHNIIPCDTAVWTQQGIDDLRSHGLLQSFGYPTAGTVLTDSKRGRIKHLDFYVNAGFIACFGDGSVWDEEIGKKCSGQHAVNSPARTILQCQEEAEAGQFPYFQYQQGKGRCKVLAACDAPFVDGAWAYYSKQWTPWAYVTPQKKCTGKSRKFFLVHSQYQCQAKAEEAGLAFYTYKSGSVKKCAITNSCKWKDSPGQKFTVYSQTR